MFHLHRLTTTKFTLKPGAKRKYPNVIPWHANFSFYVNISIRFQREMFLIRSFKLKLFLHWSNFSLETDFSLTKLKLKWFFTFQNIFYRLHVISNSVNGEVLRLPSEKQMPETLKKKKGKIPTGTFLASQLVLSFFCSDSLAENSNGRKVQQMES